MAPPTGMRFRSHTRVARSLQDAREAAAALARAECHIMIEVDPAAHITVLGYVGLKEYIAGLFTVSVDVVDRHALKPYVRPPVEDDSIYAF